MKTKEQGMVSVETALTIPVIILALMMILTAGKAAIIQGKTCQLANQVARQYTLSQNAESQHVTAPVKPSVPAPYRQEIIGNELTITYPARVLFHLPLPAISCQAQILPAAAHAKP
ncbi:TadE/TadG family type IV pilus assembly protein [Boudabousia liubingyangii]|nr:TadE family protein [Boudabousia liubingyangii]